MKKRITILCKILLGLLLLIPESIIIFFRWLFTGKAHDSYYVDAIGELVDYDLNRQDVL